MLLNKKLFKSCTLYPYVVVCLCLSAHAQSLLPHELWGSWQEISTWGTDLQSIITFEKDGTYRLQIGELSAEGRWRLNRRRSKIHIRKFRYLNASQHEQVLDQEYNFTLDAQKHDASTLIIQRKRNGKTYTATYQKR